MANASDQFVLRTLPGPARDVSRTNGDAARYAWLCCAVLHSSLISLAQLHYKGGGAVLNYNLTDRRNGIIGANKLVAAILVSLILLITSGCASATVGARYVHHNIENIAIGTTSRSDAVRFFGPPYGTINTSNSDGDFAILKYLYAFAKTGSPTGSRVLLLEFKESILNAYVSLSTFEEDSTEFDFEAGKRIQAHRSKKADTLQSVGEPAGKAICPSTLTEYKDFCVPGREVWMWLFNSKEGRKTVTSTLRVAFDDGDIVSLVDSSRESLVPYTGK